MSGPLRWPDSPTTRFHQSGPRPGKRARHEIPRSAPGPIPSRTGAPPEGPSSCPCAFRPKLSLRVLPHSSAPAIPSEARLRMRVLPLPPLVHLGLGPQRGSASRGRRPPGHPLRRQAQPHIRESELSRRNTRSRPPRGLTWKTTGVKKPEEALLPCSLCEWLQVRLLYPLVHPLAFPRRPMPRTCRPPGEPGYGSCQPMLGTRCSGVSSPRDERRSSVLPLPPGHPLWKPSGGEKNRRWRGGREFPARGNSV